MINNREFYRANRYGEIHNSLTQFLLPRGIMFTPLTYEERLAVKNAMIAHENSDRLPRIGTVWSNTKSTSFRLVIGFARDSQTRQRSILYQNLTDGICYIDKFEHWLASSLRFNGIILTRESVMDQYFGDEEPENQTERN